MQPFLGRFEPRLEPVTIPALRLDPHDPRALNNKTGRGGFAGFEYLPRDGGVAGGDLPGGDPQPGGEVGALGERFPTADRSYDCAGDDRPDPWYTHQALTAGILAR